MYVAEQKWSKLCLFTFIHYTLIYPDVTKQLGRIERT
jgi:hypothetical protein